MKDETANRFLPRDAGSALTAGGLELTLGPPQPLPFPGFAREGLAKDGTAHRVLELPGSAPPAWLDAALEIPGVATALARESTIDRVFLVLRPAPGPSLESVILRSEGLPLWELDLFGSLADLFEAVHAAKLGFRHLLPALFSVGPGGAVQLEAPEALRPADEPPPTAATLFTAPEVVDGHDAGARSDQYGLALLCYALLTGRFPIERGELPLPRIFRPTLPHGAFACLTRASAPDPLHRYESVRAFADDLRARTLPRGRGAAKLRVGAATEIGRLKKEQLPVNQDAFFVGRDEPTGRGLLLVADGVSTADVGSGDLASAMVRDATRQAWEGAVGDILRGHKGALPAVWAKAALEAILEDAQARIYAFLKQPIFVGTLGPMTHPPGSTAVLATVDGDRLWIANLGDSRVYLLRDGALEQMTVDQDLKTDLLKAGRDPRAVSDPGALGALTHSVGSFFFDPDGGINSRRLDPDFQQLHLRAGDRLLLCSDGIPDCLGEGHEQVIARELADGDDADKIAARLCRLADEALGGDNMTALVVLALG